MSFGENNFEKKKDLSGQRLQGSVYMTHNFQLN